MKDILRMVKETESGLYINGGRKLQKENTRMGKKTGNGLFLRMTPHII